MKQSEIDKLIEERERLRIEEIRSLSYVERFERLMVLIKLSYEMRNAKVIYRKK